MKKLAELRKRLGDLKASGLKIVDVAEADDRDMTEAEQAKYDGIKAEIEEVEASITRAERLAEERRSMAPVPYGTNTVDDPNPETTHGFKDMAEFSPRSATHRSVVAVSSIPA